MSKNSMILQDGIAGTYIANIGSHILYINPAAIALMRDWVSECIWNEDCETSEFSDVEIIRGVNRHFDGGLFGFFQSI